MAVLVEAISIVIIADRIHDRFPGGWEEFRASVPNQTLCADNELVRVGFMVPADVEAYVASLSPHNIRYLIDGKARDLVVVDQLRGPMAACEWIEFGHVLLGEGTKVRVAACRKVGSTSMQVVAPPAWAFESSLSSSYGFVPNEHADKSLKFLRHERGLDVYLNEVTGKEVFVGRSATIGRAG
jgi:hypothetical protein